MTACSYPSGIAQVDRAAALAGSDNSQLDRKVVGSIRGCSTVDLFKVLLPNAYSSSGCPADEAGMLKPVPNLSDGLFLDPETFD